MANEVSLNGASGQSKAASQLGSFPFTSEQCQQLLSLLSSHASSSTTLDAIHLANSALLGISCASFQDSTCLSLKNSIFTKNPSNKTTYNEETWVLDTGATDHIIIPFLCLLRSLIQYLLLCIYPMVKKSLPHTQAQSRLLHP